MTLSRRSTPIGFAVLVLAGAVAGTARADPPAPSPIEAERQAFGLIRHRCPVGHAADEIVVCRDAEANARQRLPLPVAPDPGARVVGEAVSQVAAADYRPFNCGTSATGYGCLQGVRIVGVDSAGHLSTGVPVLDRLVSRAEDEGGDVSDTSSSQSKGQVGPMP